MLGVNQRLVARVAQPDRVRDCKSDELRIDDRRQFDEVDAVREADERLRRLWRALTRFEVPERLFRAEGRHPVPADLRGVALVLVRPQRPLPRRLRRLRHDPNPAAVSLVAIWVLAFSLTPA